jgi:hypothetical protein
LRLTFDKSPVRERRTPGPVRGARGNSRLYRDQKQPLALYTDLGHSGQFPTEHFRILRDWSNFQQANSDPKLLALNRFASPKASSSDSRNVPGFLSTQRSPDERDAKKKMKWQNFAITFAADVPKTCASGRMKDISVPIGSTDSIRSEVMTRRIISPLSGSIHDARAGRPRISGMNRLSQSAPCRERAAVHLEAMMHGRRREAAEATDPTLVIGVDE